MLDGSAQADSLDTMKAAFSAAGKMTPHEEAVAILNDCWERHKPDVTKARIAFSEALTAMAPIVRAVIGETEWANRIASFSQQNCSELAKCVRRRIGHLAVLSRYGDKPVSQSRSAITARNWREKKGLSNPVATLTPVSIAPSPQAVRCKAGNAARKDRERRNVTLAKVEIDKRTGEITALLTKLPASLQSFATWTADRALAWCERQEQHAGMVRVWCQMTVDPRKTLGEQLTPEIVAALTA